MKYKYNVKSIEMFGKIVDKANDMVILEIIDGSNNYRGYTLSEIFYIFGIDLPNSKYWKLEKNNFQFFGNLLLLL